MNYWVQHLINLFEQWQGSPCCYLPVQEHKGIVMEQPSLLSSLRNSVTASTVEPLLGGLGTFSSVSPTDERSPDGVSSSSEATETGWYSHFPQEFCRCLSWKHLNRNLNETKSSSLKNIFLYIFFSCMCPFLSCPSSPESPGSSLQHRELFCPSAQHIRQQQSVFFGSQRAHTLTAGSTKTRGHRQPVSG